MRLDAGEVDVVEVSDQADGSETRDAPRIAHAAVELTDVLVEQLGERGKRDVATLQVVGNHRELPRGARVGERAPLAVDDLPARRLEADRPYRVPLRLLAQLRGLDDLELEQAQLEDRERGAEQGGEQAQPAVEREIRPRQMGHRSTGRRVSSRISRRASLSSNRSQIRRTRPPTNGAKGAVTIARTARFSSSRAWSGNSPRNRRVSPAWPKPSSHTIAKAKTASGSPRRRSSCPAMARVETSSSRRRHASCPSSVSDTMSAPRPTPAATISPDPVPSTRAVDSVSSSERSGTARAGSRLAAAPWTSAASSPSASSARVGLIARRPFPRARARRGRRPRRRRADPWWARAAASRRPARAGRSPRRA